VEQFSPAGNAVKVANVIGLSQSIAAIAERADSER
jgi:hypothetical protein